MKMLNTDKVNMLHLVQSLGVGGAEILLLNYIKALGTARYRHFVYCFESSGPIKDEVEKIGATLVFGPSRHSIKNPFKFSLSILRLFHDLIKFVIHHDIDIIQSHLRHANQLGTIVGKLTRTPTFPTVHNTMAFIDQNPKRDLKSAFIKLVDGIIYRIADNIIAVSDEIKQIILNSFHLEEPKVVVLKNGILYSDSKSKPVNLREIYSLNNDSIILISVGSLTYQKAFDVLIRAAANLVKDGYDNFVLLIVGDGEEKNNLEKIIDDLKIRHWVKLVGIKRNIIDLLKASDIFIMPSRYEGLSIAMIEAMACGLPIIASNAPGLNTYISHNHNGLLFPTDNHDQLSTCIKKLIKSPSLRIKISNEVSIQFESEYNLQQNILPLEVLIRQYLAD